MNEIPKVEEVLRDVDENEAFVMKNGLKLYSLQELAEALKIVSDDVYKYHANETKNDFSTWIKDVFGDYVLASRVFVAKNKFDAAERIEKRIEFLSERKKVEQNYQESKAWKQVSIYDLLIGFILGVLFAWFLTLIL